ncbi:TadE family type IV pilus minor pilin [Microbacterium sp. B35-04]|uniref:TadE family type IV pilus minor pilin n=1 Tax=Microbacterium sp. B35-04 TaxID=1961716 RepID=UPI001EF899C6|nr:TadE family type IV pilus minor pilin [Microbacterium sp. B35-04]
MTRPRLGDDQRLRPSAGKRLRPSADKRLRPSADGGAVVAEFAVALPAIVLVLVLGVGALAGAARQVRLQDAVADAARLSARGEPDQRARDAVSAAVAGASVEIAPRGDLVCVSASASALFGFRIEATGCALGGGL